MNIVKQKGTKDIYGNDIKTWQYAEEIMRKVCRSYNVSEIRTPVFEATELYMRGVGDETDIVSKEMYSFVDRGGRSITLRPELTAGIVRAYVENGFASITQPVKLWYSSNMYRYEKMQKGRYREFSQFGVEIFGSSSYLADLESIVISSAFLEEIGLKDKVVLNINSIGCKECRKKYLDTLREYLSDKIDNMCDTCKVRYNKNIMRIIDCKEDKCKKIVDDAPMILDNLCDECKSDFENLKNGLDALNIKYVIDKKIVRGLDYYNKTVYEYTSKDLGLSVGGGGRYDMLVEQLGGSKTPAVGFAFGTDRIILLLNEYGIIPKNKYPVDIYFATLTDKANIHITNVINKLRKNGYIVEKDISNRSFKAQLKYANNIGARYTCIIGEDEISTNTCQLKDMETGIQINIKMENIEEVLREEIGDKYAQI